MRTHLILGLLLGGLSLLNPLAHADDKKDPAKDAPAPVSKPVDGAPVAPGAKDPAPKPANTEKKTEAKEQIVHVTMKTSMGDIVLELDGVKAPLSTENFLKYVDDKHYDGTVFHRVINGFMIQGGGFTPAGEQKKTRAPIKNEGGNGLKNEKYTIAMARTNVPDSATSQFYINVANNAALDRANSRDQVGYAVFGRVVGGTETVEKIKAVTTTIKRTPNGPMQDWPQADVSIIEARRSTQAEIDAIKK
jgi:peptidyl-prolyl cis-trans isomerase A (cyclophilin A)